MSQGDHHYTTEKQLQRLAEIGFGEGSPDIAYAARLLFHTMMPHSAQEAREWKRSNGRVRVYIQAGPETGLPYGSYPRLVFLWLVTEAFKTKSRRLVLGHSLSDFMNQLGLLPTGGRWGTITKLREQMRRLFSARIVAYLAKQEGDEVGEEMQTLDVARKYDLWWNPKDPGQATIWESTVELGESFYETITRHPFPVDMRVLKALKRSPLGLDLYTMLTYRVAYLKKPVAISWRQLHAQFGADYAGDKNGMDKFTKAAKRELTKIKAAWPELDYETPRGRLLIRPGEPSVKRLLKA
jgi:hypothetical protein